MAGVVATVDDTLAFFTEVDEVFLHLNDPAARVTNKLIPGDIPSFQVQIKIYASSSQQMSPVKISLSDSHFGRTGCAHLSPKC